jgi:hypothetical protein
MKTMKLIIAMIMICSVSSIMAQTAKPAAGKPTAAKMNYYFVSAPHTEATCMNNADELKDKGDAFLSKFYFGCHHGDHTSYAILQGTSEDAVRKTLIKSQQDVAKIVPVDKMTVDEILKYHKDSK